LRGAKPRSATAHECSTAQSLNFLQLRRFFEPLPLSQAGCKVIAQGLRIIKREKAVA